MTWRRRSQVYSKTLLIGRLGASAESRFTESGSRVVNLRVATNEYRKGEDGERTEITD
jgi:single-stranded DNA-binding protein